MTLASIQKILSVEPIEEADRIEKISVLGWECVAKKGVFKEGDLCIYIEIDTLIPKYLLTDNLEDTEKIRLKTVKMRGQISQGLVLPINNNFYFDFMTWREECKFSDMEIPELIEGQDVTDLLEIEKYEKPIPLSMEELVKGNFPSFLSKTDETNIQSEPNLVSLIWGKPYYITKKMDGTSATYYKFEGKFGVCSRNLELKDGNNIYWNMARKYDLENIIKDGMCIQGEICGPNIQKNKLGLKELDLFIFNCYAIKGRQYVEPKWLLSNYKLSFVPYIETGENFHHTFSELLKIAGETLYDNLTPAEGVVVRSLDQKVSFKVLNSSFLLRYEE